MKEEEISKSIATSMKFTWLKISKSTTPEEWDASTEKIISIKIPEKVSELFKNMYLESQEALKYFNINGSENLKNYSLADLERDMFTFIIFEGITSIQNRGEKIVKDYISLTENFLKEILGKEDQEPKD